MTFSRRKVEDNVLFDRLNNYHLNNTLTIKLHPRKFLNTMLTNTNGFYKFNGYRKTTRLPLPWTSKNLRRYKLNTINGDLPRS